MLFEGLARNASAGKQTDLVLLDFSKAFDKANHSKLSGSSNSMGSEEMHFLVSLPSLVTGHRQSFLMARNLDRSR